MTNQMIKTDHFERQARLIRNQVSRVLKKWGLIPRFKRWRLAQDPYTGMIVLFGILNNKYIASNTTIPFGNYFDPHLLRDLANELQVQVVSCNGDGLRYAFVLERGQLEKLPTHIDFPYIDDGKLFVRVVYEDTLQPAAAAPENIPAINDLTFARQVTAAFLKVFDDIKLRDDAAILLAGQNPPDVMMIDEEEFYKRVAEHEVNRQRVKRVEQLLDQAAE